MADREGLPFDRCVYCGAEGCESGTAIHAEDCPSETGVFPVREEDVYERVVCEECGHRNYVGMGCCRCDHKFQVGEFSHHILISEDGGMGGFPVYETVCAGCAAEEAILDA